MSVSKASIELHMVLHIVCQLVPRPSCVRAIHAMPSPSSLSLPGWVWAGSLRAGVHQRVQRAVAGQDKEGYRVRKRVYVTTCSNRQVYSRHVRACVRACVRVDV